MYGDGNEVDSRALKLLVRFDPLTSGRWEPETLGGLSQAEFDHAVASGLLFKPNKVEYSHSHACTKLLKAVAGGDRETHAALFLASLSSRRLDYRVGLPAYAIARTFPEHEFQSQPKSPYCTLCGMTNEGSHVARSDANRERFVAGGAIGVSPPELAFYLECQNQLQPVEPTDDDLRIFSAILDILCGAEPAETAKKRVLREVKKVPGFRANAEQAQCLLETLGYCGILETPEHGGMLERYVRLGTAPRKTHSSDWRYPVDFWTGKDGINKKAMRFWFGRYDALKRFM